jgi:hypothetical protein
MEKGSRLFATVIIRRSHKKPQFEASPSQYIRALAPHATPPVKPLSAMVFGMAPPGALVNAMSNVRRLTGRTRDKLIIKLITEALN